MKRIFLILFFLFQLFSYSQNPVNELEKQYSPPNEKFVDYYKNGNLRISFTRKNGDLEGSYCNYSRNGKKLSVYYFEYGHFHGLDTNYNNREQIISEEQYSHDTLLYLKTTTYHKNNKIKEEYMLHFDTDSLKICPFQKIKYSIGLRFTYDVTRYIENMKSHGQFIEYHKNGKIKEEAPIVNGLYEGLVKGYYEDGKLYWEGSYHLDWAEGIFTYYSKTGEITKRETWTKGKKVN